MIRDAHETDAAAVAAVYNPYITDLLTSFEFQPVAPETMAGRIQRVRQRYPWLVYEAGGQLHGYAYASRWKERDAYHYCAECTVYLRPGSEGQGIGTALYRALLARLPDCEVQVAIGCIALPNDASVALHEKLGFEKVGHFTHVGFKFGQWIDIGYWQKRLQGTDTPDNAQQDAVHSAPPN